MSWGSFLVKKEVTPRLRSPDNTPGEGARRISTLIWGSQNQTIDCSTEEGDKLKDFKGGIDLQHIDFRYPSRPKQQIYGGPGFPDGYSLKIEPGETVALVGPS